MNDSDKSAQQEIPTPTDRSTGKRNVWRIMTFSLSLVVGISWLLFQQMQASPPEAGTTQSSLATGIKGASVSGKSTDSATPTQDEPVVTKDQILGTWVLDGGIRRVIENRNDGTASIDVTFDFLTSLRYGSTLHLNLEWTLKDNVLTHTILDGSPELGKKRLIADFGPKSYFKIVSISEDKMHLIDFDKPPEEYHWVRMKEE